MQSYIISGGDEQGRALKAQELSTQRGIDQFDISFINTDEEDEKSISIGIKEVKLLQQKLMLKPYKGLSKACIVKDAEKLTFPAQNALLKVLEEPPENTFIFLLLQNARSLLPTIRSRCSEIDISPKEKPQEFENEHEIMTEWSALQHETINQKLKRAQDLAKNKDESIELLKKYLHVLSRDLHSSIKEGRGDKGVLIENIQSLQESFRLLTTTNTNPRLIFERLFLSL